MGWKEWLPVGRAKDSGGAPPATDRVGGSSAADQDSLLARARTLLAAGAFSQAESSAQELIRLDPYSAPAHIVLAIALVGQNRGEAARDAAQRAIWIEPDDVQGHVALALAWLADDRAGEGEAAARRAVAVDPLSAEAHSALAAALEMRGDKGEARREIDRAIALEPAEAGGERIWKDWRAPLVGAIGLASFLAYHALGVLGTRFTDRIVALVLLGVVAAFLVAVLVGLHRQRRRLARLSPGARLTVRLEARRRRAAGWSALAGPVAIITAIVAVLSVITVMFAAGQKATVELAVGDCFSAEPGTVISQIATIPCQLPHDVEIYAVLSDPAPAGASYPGFDVLIARLETRCEALYPGYVGVPYGRNAPARIQTYAPLEVYWVVNIRSLFCGLRDPAGGQLVGSKRNAASSAPSP